MISLPYKLSFVSTRFCTPFGVSRMVCGRPILPTPWVVPTASTVNAALVASQWQHRASTFPLNPLIHAEHEAGQAVNAVFEVFGMALLGIKPSLPVFDGACTTNYTTKVRIRANASPKFSKTRLVDRYSMSIILPPKISAGCGLDATVP